MGIGPGVEEDTLHDIAGTGPVIQVENFDKLDETIQKIKGSACSGTFSRRILRNRPLLN